MELLAAILLKKFCKMFLRPGASILEIIKARILDISYQSY